MSKHVKTLTLRNLTFLLVMGAATVSCGDSNGSCDVFVALQRDFAGYRSWNYHDAGDAPLSGHPAGQRNVYVNNPLPAGATSYPVGTIIVKEIQISATPGDVELFAMVKRGCGYNAEGAVGWEFFVLSVDATGTPLIQARGIDPSAGDVYATAGGTGCNSCHAASGTEVHDYILEPSLQPGGGM